MECQDKAVQTLIQKTSDCNLNEKCVEIQTKPCRSLEDCMKIYESDLGASVLSDDEVILLVRNKRILAYQIEKAVDDPERGVGIRRKLLSVDGGFTNALNDLPYKNYDYGKVVK